MIDANIHIYIVHAPLYKNIVHLSAHVLKVQQYTVYQCYVKKIARTRIANGWILRYIRGWHPSYDVCHMQCAKHTHSILLTDMPTGKERTCQRIRRHACMKIYHHQ